jgi:hypothetical protein
VHQVHFLNVERVFEARGDPGNLREVDHEQENEGDVDLPRALQDTGARDRKAALQHHAAIDEGRGVARNEHKHFGGIAEAEIAGGEPANEIRRDVVQEDQPERHAAEEIEPQVARLRRKSDGADGDGKRQGKAHAPGP